MEPGPIGRLVPASGPQAQEFLLAGHSEFLIPCLDILMQFVDFLRQALGTRVWCRGCAGFASWVQDEWVPTRPRGLLLKVGLGSYGFITNLERGWSILPWYLAKTATGWAGDPQPANNQEGHFNLLGLKMRHSHTIYEQVVCFEQI